MKPDPYTLVLAKIADFGAVGRVDYCMLLYWTPDGWRTSGWGTKHGDKPLSSDGPEQVVTSWCYINHINPRVWEVAID